jgi:serine/threonine protein kinase
MVVKDSSLSAATPGCPGGVSALHGAAADAPAGGSSSNRASNRAAVVRTYKNPATIVKEELERVLNHLEDKQPAAAQQLALVEDLLCRMLVLDPDQRPAAADLLGHPFFELGRVGQQLPAPP